MILCRQELTCLVKLTVLVLSSLQELHTPFYFTPTKVSGFFHSTTPSLDTVSCANIFHSRCLCQVFTPPPLDPLYCTQATTCRAHTHVLGQSRQTRRAARYTTSSARGRSCTLCGWRRLERRHPRGGCFQKSPRECHFLFIYPPGGGQFQSACSGSL